MSTELGPNPKIAEAARRAKEAITAQNHKLTKRVDVGGSIVAWNLFLFKGKGTVTLTSFFKESYLPSTLLDPVVYQPIYL